MNYTVLPGDTLGQIAKRNNVPVSSITGYRSGDPKLIFPGEVLTIGQGTPQAQSGQPNNVTDIFPDGFTAALQGTQSQPGAPVAPQAQLPVAPAPLALGQPQAIQQPAPTAQPQPVAAAPVAPTAQPVAPQAITRSFKTPTGQDITMDVSPESDLALGGEATRNQPVPDQARQEADTYFGQFGVPSEALEAGFQSNPTGTLSDLIRLVMEQTGMPEARQQVAMISKEIEDLSNERDQRIAAIGDDPFTSSGTKSALGQKIADEYERRITNRTNRLTLMQNAYSDAQQQAQFAATTAISLFDKQRTFDQKRIDDAILRAEKQAQAERDIEKDNKPIEISAGATLYDPKTGNAIFRAPENTKAGDVASPGEYTPKQLTALNRINENVSKNQNYARTASMRNAVDNVLVALSQKTGVSDIAAINQFQKIIDDGAVTRDQDVKLIQGAQSIANRLKTRIDALESGQQLSEDQRSEMKTLVESIYSAQTKALQKDPYIKTKKTEAERNGIKVEDTILGELSSFDNQETGNPAPTTTSSPEIDAYLNTLKLPSNALFGKPSGFFQ